MNQRIKLNVDSLVLDSRVHSRGDVIEVDEDQYKRLVKVEKAAVDSDEELTVFPEPVFPVPETATEDPPSSPDGGQGGSVKAVAKSGTKR